MSAHDAELVRRVMAGQREAFTALVATHLPRARAIARSVMGDDQGVDDAVQDAFIRAYERLGQLADGEGFPSWLAAIVRNRAIDELRRRRSGRQVAINEAAAVARPSWQQDDDEDEDPRLERLRKALAQLKPEQREVIALKYEAGLDYEAIAETLGTSVSTVEKRLYRARQALLALMPNI